MSRQAFPIGMIRWNDQNKHYRKRKNTAELGDETDNHEDDEEI